MVGYATVGRDIQQLAVHIEYFVHSEETFRNPFLNMLSGNGAVDPKNQLYTAKCSLRALKRGRVESPPAIVLSLAEGHRMPVDSVGSDFVKAMLVYNGCEVARNGGRLPPRGRYSPEHDEVLRV